MGCWCSKEDPAHQSVTRHCSHSRVANNDERQQSAPRASSRSPSGQNPLELNVSEEQQGYSGRQRSQQSPARIDTAFAGKAPQETSSQRTAGTRSNHNLERSPNTATPSSQYKEGVLGELEKLRSLVMDFVDRCFSQSSESDRSEARKTIYRLVLENAERPKNSRSQEVEEEIADAVEDEFKMLNCGPFSSPNRQRSDLLLICERNARIRDELKRDAGYWKFKWRRGDESLEFPAAQRDEVQLYDGHPLRQSAKA